MDYDQRSDVVKYVWKLFIQSLTKEYTVNRSSGRVWVNFNELRSKLKMEEVLRLYKVKIERDGNQHTGRCPLPCHTCDPDPACFSANLEKGIFQCFGCKAKGNVLEFAAMMEKVNPENGAALRKVAVKLQEHFFPKEHSNQKKSGPQQQELLAESGELPVLVNPPLDFELKGLEHGHQWLVKRGINLQTAVYFGVGACSRGMLKDCLAIPLHDASGVLVGYAGRPIDDEAMGDEASRYSLPVRRERKGTVVEFSKSAFVYNGYRLKAPCEALVVVEGFASVWWLCQNGIRDVVSTMGTSLSDAQSQLLVSHVGPTGTVLVIPTEDSEGEQFALEVFKRVAPYRRVRWVKLERGQSVTQLRPDQLKASVAL